MTTYTTKALILCLLSMWLGIFGISTGYALTFSETQKLLASDGEANDYFGVAVSIDGDTAVIGASQSGFIFAGSAYVYVRDSAGVWNEHQELTASDTTYFGCSVSIDGDTIVIGVCADSVTASFAGAAYVFTRDGAGMWHEQQKLTASDGAVDDSFGLSVSIDGDTAVIGAWQDNDKGIHSGSAYVFVRNGLGIWREQQKINASDGAEGDRFGVSVSISGNTAVIGAEDDSNYGFFGTGSAYVFERDGTGIWREQQKLIASDAAAATYFGISVSIEGNTVVIGAWADSINGGAGAAYVFVRDGAGVWHEHQKLTARDAQEGAYFGFSVSLSGDKVVIGAWQDNGNGDYSGSAYVFAHDGTGVWREQQKLIASNVANGAHFGSSVSISGNTAIIGAWRDDKNGHYSGSAYVFDGSDLVIEKLINHRASPTPDTAAQLLVGTRYRADYKVTNNSPDRIYRVRVFEDGELVCNLYDLMPGQSKQPGRCTNFNNVLAGLNNVPANVTAKVSGSNQDLANQSNAYYTGFGNVAGQLKVTHYVNNRNADTQGSAVDVNSNEAEVLFRVENTGSIKLYRVKTYHDPASPVNSGWQEQCFIGTLMPGQVRYCKKTISVTEAGLNKAFGRAQGEDANVSPIGYENASNPTYFNVVLP